MKFYYSPGACSLGIHLLLEEMGAEYQGIVVQLKAGEQFKDAFVQVNPKSKVPALVRDDGSLLTEFGSIARWLAHEKGGEEFKSLSFEDEVRATETLDYIVGTVHMQGFTRIFRPVKFTPHEVDYEWVQDVGKEIVMKAMGHLSSQLGNKTFIMGDRMSIADAALFYTLFWGVKRISLDLPTNLMDYYTRMSARPAAQRVFQLEELL